MSTPVSFIKHLRLLKHQKSLHAASLVVTLFGDTFSQHGNNVWLGSLISALDLFGLNQRMVRSAVFRLVKDEWLVARKIGRRSYYSLSDKGIRKTEALSQRLYAAGRKKWDGTWTVAVVDPEYMSRDSLRKTLTNLGFVSLPGGSMIYPADDTITALEQILIEHDLIDKVAIIRGPAVCDSSASLMQKLLFERHDFVVLADEYTEFLHRFRPVLLEMQNTSTQVSDQTCFQIRSLLVHEFRHILMLDSEWPDELLPHNWPGESAYHVLEALYRRVHEGALNFTLNEFETASGSMLPVKSQYYQRFGGLS